MKKLKLPPDIREQYDLLLVDGAARWPAFEKRFTAAFTSAWRRLVDNERTTLLESWGKWRKGKKPQVWVKFVDALPSEAWTAYEPTGGIFTLAVPRCLPMPDELFAVFIAHEVLRAMRVAQGVALRDSLIEEQHISLANAQAGYNEEAMQQWIDMRAPR